MKTAFILFAKPPLKGFAKTRIAKLLGDDFSHNLYQMMLQWQWQNINDILAIKDKKDQVIVYTTSPSDVSFYRCKRLLRQSGLSAKIKIKKQSKGSLGDKLNHACDQTFKKFDNIIIWGADIALIHKGHFQAVKDNISEANLIPATDGGYCLISLSKKSYIPSLFKNIRWSTNKTFEDQRFNFNQAKIKVKILDTLPDLDLARDIAGNILFMDKHPHSSYTNRLKDLKALLLDTASSSSK